MYASCLAGTGCALSLGWVCKLMNPFWLKSEPNWLHLSSFPSLPPYEIGLRWIILSCRGSHHWGWLISTWSSTILAPGGSDPTCVASWVNRSAEQGVRIQPVLLCRSIPAQHSKALSCEEQVETVRSDRKKEKAMRTWAWSMWTVLNINALHLTTNVYIYIYILFTCIHIYNIYIYTNKYIQ